MYFSSVLTVSVISAIVGILCPENAKLGKYVRYSVSLVMLLCVISPLIKLDISNIKLPEVSIDTDTEAADPREVILNTAEKSLKNDIAKELFRKFRVSEDYAEIDLSLSAEDYGDIRIKNITVTLKSYGAWADSAGIIKHFSEKYETKVDVVYE